MNANFELDRPRAQLDAARLTVWTSRTNLMQIVKVRWVKPYEAAQNHICIGEVLEQGAQYLKILGRTFHYGRTPTTRSLGASPEKVRWIPWSRIEVVTELHPETDWRNLQLQVDATGKLCVVGATNAHSELVAD